ncbi:hypothetical protein SAMN05443292_1529 [Halpernia frigidisoli]|uniref:Uncharacterized protein n=1 Tax=Halpernia frigidisoli TaxID=1125876 RepID=A0A1I3FPK2_9FLAO|nr:hypothetical protein SAMN05443292_1529 [Halpernia frigidisoli]
MNLWKALLFTIIFISCDAVIYLIFVSPFELNLIEDLKFYSGLQLLSKIVFSV